MKKYKYNGKFMSKNHLAFLATGYMYDITKTKSKNAGKITFKFFIVFFSILISLIIKTITNIIL